MVLESLNPIENDKPLKKNIFFYLGGCSTPPNPPIFRFLGGFGGPRTPPKIFKNIFSKANHFLWGLSFPEPSN